MEVRRNTRTTAAFARQSFSQASATDYRPLIQGANDLAAGLDANRRSRQQFELQKRLLEETNSLTADLETRRRDPEFDVDNFSTNIDAAYTDRVNAVADEFRSKGFDPDLVADFTLGMSRTRNALTDAATGYQISARAQRAAVQSSQLIDEGTRTVATNPDAYAETVAYVSDTIDMNPDLTDEERSKLKEQVPAAIRTVAAESLLMDNPADVLEQLDPDKRWRSERAAIVSGASGEGPGTAVGGAQDSIRQAAEKLGVSPVELAGIASYESGGTLRPSVTGGDGGRYVGLFQFGPEEQRKYGVSPSSTFEEQVDALVRFANDRGYRPGMGWKKLYTTINAGNPNASVKAADSNGTQEDHYRKVEAEHFGNGRKFLGVEDRPTDSMGRRVSMPGDVAPVDLPASSVAEPTPAEAFPTPIEPGNLSLEIQNRVKNEDGSISTVRTISIGTDKGEVVLPTVINGKIVSDEEAIAHYERTGENFGTFANEEEAKAFSVALHNKHEKELGAPRKPLHPALAALTGDERLRVLSAADKQVAQQASNMKAEMDLRIANIKAQAESGTVSIPVPTVEELSPLYGEVAAGQIVAEIGALQQRGSFMQDWETASVSSMDAELDSLKPAQDDPALATKMPIYEQAKAARDAIVKKRLEDPAAYAIATNPAIQAAIASGDSRKFYELQRAEQARLGIPASARNPWPQEYIGGEKKRYKTLPVQARYDWFIRHRNGATSAEFENFVREFEGTDAYDDLLMSSMVAKTRGQKEMSRVLPIILQGSALIKQDPARRPPRDKLLKEFQTQLLTGITNTSPNMSRSIRNAADAIYVARGNDPVNVNPTAYQESLREAVGGKYADSQTGWANYGKNGVKDLTILPAGVTRNQFDNWMTSLTNAQLTGLAINGAPRYATGELVSARDIVDEGVLVMVEPNVYTVKFRKSGNVTEGAFGADNRPVRISITPQIIVGAPARARPRIGATPPRGRKE